MNLSSSPPENYQDVIDEIYASYLRNKSRVENRHDRFVRDPDILLALAARLGLIPDPARLVRVTGSKGKGTTTKLIGRILGAETGRPVGVLLSPEEFDHNDRIRIDDRPIERAALVSAYNRIRADLQAIEAALPPDKYLSPFGTFLLIALTHFQEAGAAYLVFEGGRGARYDEVGNLRSDLSVVTSILFEHPTYIGPTFDDIARNKLFIGTRSKHLVCDEEVAAINARLDVVDRERVVIAPAEVEDFRFPFWYRKDLALARAAVSLVVGRPVAGEVAAADGSPSFGTGAVGGVNLFYEACINAGSIDRAFFQSIHAGQKRLAVLSSLPDDKDTVGVRSFFVESGVPYFEIVLTGSRGFLNYDTAKASGRVVAEVGYDDAEGLVAVLRSVLAKGGYDGLYLIGTQTFIRLVKNALHRLAG